jgi:hypothetical protein
MEGDVQVSDRKGEPLYDAAITCAHRALAEEVIASLVVKKRVAMGVFGLAARVRAKVRELEGLPRQPKLARRKELDNVKGELADMREELTAARSENPFASRPARWRASSCGSCDGALLGRRRRFMAARTVSRRRNALWRVDRQLQCIRSRWATGSGSIRLG